MDNERYLQAVERLHQWQYAGLDSFTACLFNLFMKADPMNRLKLGVGFPEEFLAFREWNDSSDQEAFFKKYGLSTTGSPL